MQFTKLHALKNMVYLNMLIKEFSMTKKEIVLSLINKIGVHQVLKSHLLAINFAFFRKTLVIVIL